jgi:fructosamine-3-kinase
VRDLTDLNDLASHPCAIVSDGAYAVFVKLSEAANGLEQFEAERAGLQLLSAHSGVRTPSAINNIEVEGGAVMVLEAISAIERGPRQWRDIGHALAQVHGVKSAWCGLETHGYFGPLYQDNRPIQDWPTFYAERRLWPRLMSAIDSGHLPSAAIRDVEKLIARVPNLCGPAVTPCLLHGDAQQNNFISTDAGAVIVDPAVHYGHPEYDLALLDYFQPVPDEVFAAYREVLPIDPGFSERRDLWRVYAYLAIVTLEPQPKYMSWLMNAVERYL